MRNFWLVAKQEYKRMVFRRAFILVTLAIPLGMAVLIALAIVVALASVNTSPIGYIDESGLLDIGRYEPLKEEEDRLELVLYTDLEAGLAAVESGAIQALYVVPAGYPTSQPIDLYYDQEYPGSDVWNDFRDFLRVNLLATYPAAIADRLYEGPSSQVIDTSSNRTFSQNAVINVILPFVASFLFFVATMSASGYMLQVVADEKENRTMEIMLTSVSPGQLIAGKMVGLLLAALTQLGIYVAAGIIGILIARPYVPQFQVITVPWGYLAIMIAFFLPAYTLLAATMVAIGSAVTELQQGQQVAGILNLLFILPIMLLAMIFENPSAPLLIFMTFFPTTSFLTISLRWGVATVPYWHIAISWLILVGSALFMIWAASRIFRLGMLRYGQTIRFGTALAALAGRSEHHA